MATPKDRMFDAYIGKVRMLPNEPREEELTQQQPVVPLPPPQISPPPPGPEYDPDQLLSMDDDAMTPTERRPDYDVVYGDVYYGSGNDFERGQLLSGNEGYMWAPAEGPSAAEPQIVPPGHPLLEELVTGVDVGTPYAELQQNAPGIGVSVGMPYVSGLEPPPAFDVSVGEPEFGEPGIPREELALDTTSITDERPGGKSRPEQAEDKQKKKRRRSRKRRKNR